MTRRYQPVRLPTGEPNPRHIERLRAKPLSRFDAGLVCAWDGEGLTRADGSHDYVLMCSSAGDSVWSDTALSTAECLALLCERARTSDRRTIHVIFGGSYDVNCWLRDISKQELKRLWAGRWVRICGGRYRVQYRPRKSFVVWDLLRPVRLTLWDIWGFFQASFVGALTAYGIPVPEHMADMKAHRSAFSATEQKQITDYCLDECRLLRQLMETVIQHCKTADMTLRRWDGAGACAASLHHRERTMDHKGTPPSAVMRAAQYAYAGGRIELLQYGHAPKTPIYHYDINSAYPAAMSSLPSLATGRWVHSHAGPSGAPDSGARVFRVSRVAWAFDSTRCRAYPFFWRDSTGNIYYPPTGAGWYWSPEIDSARRALAEGTLRGSLTIHESWTYKSDADVRPFSWIQPLYDQRRAWKLAGIGAEKMLKLGLNSLYGKTAQHAGGTKTDAPRYHQLEWAGYITSVTRARLFDALALAGADGLMLATDGIFSTVPLDLAVGPELGAWDMAVHTGATIVQSGVYWLDDMMTETGYSRGFDKSSLDRKRIIWAWKRGESEYAAQLTRFVTMGAVASGHAPSDHWRRWITGPRVLQLTPEGTKRATIKAPRNPARGFVPTVPAIPAGQIAGSRESAVYALPWVDERGMGDETQFARERQEFSDALAAEDQ